MTARQNFDHAYSVECAYRDYCQQTSESFMAAFNGEPAMVDWFMQATMQIKPQEATEAALDLLQESGPRAALMAMFKGSTCTLVAGLKQAIIDEHIKLYGEDVAAARGAP